MLVYALPASAANYENPAQELKTMGLFKGTDKGFELDRAASRVEAAVMLVRLLGTEATALDQYEDGMIAHPFTDVPKWASASVAWLYSNNLTKGVSATAFGTTNCSAQMYCTFVLRALGYSEEAGDFTYAEALEKASELGFYNEAYFGTDFWRDDVVAISYQALATSVKGNSKSLIEMLVANGAVDATAATDFLSKQALYREYAAATSSAADASAVSMTIDTTSTYTCPELSLNQTSKSQTASSYILDQDNFQAAISIVSTDGSTATTVQEWIKDGFLYLNSNGAKTKTDLGSLIANATILSAAEAVAAVDPFYLVKDITKDSAGVYTITYDSSLTFLVEQLLASSNIIGAETQIVDFKGIVLKVSFDSAGRIKSATSTMGLTLSMVAEGTTYTLVIDYASSQVITGWDNQVSIQFPDFSGYVENDLGFTE